MSRFDELCEIIKTRKAESFNPNTPVALIVEDWCYLTESEREEFHNLKLNMKHRTPAEAKLANELRVKNKRRGRKL